MTFIGAFEKELSNALEREVEFNKIYETMKPGDVPATYASIDLLHRAVGDYSHRILPQVISYLPLFAKVIST